MHNELWGYTEITSIYFAACGIFHSLNSLLFASNLLQFVHSIMGCAQLGANPSSINLIGSIKPGGPRPLVPDRPTAMAVQVRRRCCVSLHEVLLKLDAC